MPLSVKGFMTFLLESADKCRRYFSIPLCSALVPYNTGRVLPGAFALFQPWGAKVSCEAIRLVKMVVLLPGIRGRINNNLQINTASRGFLAACGCVSLLVLQLNLALVAVILRAIVSMSFRGWQCIRYFPYSSFPSLAKHVSFIHNSAL